MNSTCESSGEIAAPVSPTVFLVSCTALDPSAFAIHTSLSSPDPSSGVGARMERDLAAVLGQVVLGDGEVAVRDPRLGLRRDRDLPQMRLLVVLVVRVDVVFDSVPRLFVGGFWFGRREVQRRAVRRPRDVRHRASRASSTVALHRRRPAAGRSARARCRRASRRTRSSCRRATSAARSRSRRRW